MSRRPPRSTRTRTLVPDTTLFRSRTPARRKRAPVASALLQECCGFDGGVGEDAVAAGSLEGEQALHHHAIVIEPALGRGGLEHGVLAADIVGEGRDRELVLHAPITSR